MLDLRMTDAEFEKALEYALWDCVEEMAILMKANPSMDSSVAFTFIFEAIAAITGNRAAVRLPMNKELDFINSKFKEALLGFEKWVNADPKGQ